MTLQFNDGRMIDLPTAAERRQQLQADWVAMAKKLICDGVAPDSLLQDIQETIRMFCTDENVRQYGAIHKLISNPPKLSELLEMIDDEPKWTVILGGEE